MYFIIDLLSFSTPGLHIALKPEERLNFVSIKFVPDSHTNPNDLVSLIKSGAEQLRLYWTKSHMGVSARPGYSRFLFQSCCEFVLEQERYRRYEREKQNKKQSKQTT